MRAIICPDAMNTPMAGVRIHGQGAYCGLNTGSEVFLILTNPATLTFTKYIRITIIL